MILRLLVSLLALPLAAACGEDASTGASQRAGQAADGAVPNSGIQPSPGTKGPGEVDSSGGGEAGQGPGGSGGSNIDHKSGDTVSGGKKSR